jgi:hypothetical protein
LVEDMYEKDDWLMILFKGGKEVFINNSWVYYKYIKKVIEWKKVFEEETWVDVKDDCNHHDFDNNVY